MIIKKKIQALAKISRILAKAATTLVKITQPPVKPFASTCGPEVFENQAAKGWEAIDTLVHFGESLQFTNLRETLKLKEEVDVCLERLVLAVDGPLGSGPKLEFVDSKQAHIQGWVLSNC